MDILKPITNDAECLAAYNTLQDMTDHEEKKILISRIEEYENSIVVSRPAPAIFIKYAMLRKKMTQTDLAIHLGSRGRVSELIHGKRTPTLNEIKILRKLLGLHADDLIEDTQEVTAFPRFPVGEMHKRGWLSSAPRALDKIKQLIEALCQKVGCTHDLIANAAFRKSTTEHFKSNSTSLTGWYMGVRLEALEVIKNLVEYRDIRDDDGFLNKVIRLSKEFQGPLQAQKFLANYGIALIVVPHLKKTYVDGCVFFMQGHPVIALSVRYDRVDSFWFTLLHELAHLVLGHVQENAPIIDDLDAVTENKREQAANRLAGRSAIPDAIWEENRGKLMRASIAAMNSVAAELGIHPAIVAGRIRKEKNDYRVLAQHVGSHEVRCLFPEVFMQSA